MTRLASPDAEKRAQALLEQGATLYEQGKLYEALSCWKQVLQIDPQNEIAGEYLRFIEENFQIGVDAFMDHHDREPEPAPARGAEPLPGQVSDGGDSYEELDWSEILDEGPDRNLKKVVAAPVPVDLSTDAGDDDFFSELKEPAPAPATSRASEAAWGANEEAGDSGIMMSMPSAMQDSALQPEFDPLSLPTSQFAAQFRAPASADLPSAPAEGGNLSGRRRRTSVVEAVSNGRRRTSGVSLPALEDSERGRDMSEMADESIQKVLDDEFKAWEDGAPALGGGAGQGRRESGHLRGRNAPPRDPDDVDDLAALLSRGLGELPSGPGAARPAAPTRGSAAVRAGNSPSAGPRSPPPSSPAPRGPSGNNPSSAGPPPRPAPRGRDPNDLESLVRAGLADLDRMPRDSGPPPRRAPEPPSFRPTPRQAPPPPPPRPSAPVMSGAPPRAPAPSGNAAPVGPPATGTDLDDLMVQARRRQAVGDFTGSLQLVEQVLAANPEHVEARRYLTENTSRLLEMYRSKLGKTTHQPRLRLRQQEIIWQSLDHRAGFLLSQVDGATSYEDLIEISGLSELEATRILARLVDQGAIG